jgi:hypothetical protein
VVFGGGGALSGGGVSGVSAARARSPGASVGTSMPLDDS